MSQPRTSHRRQFLQGKSAADALRELADSVRPSAEEAWSPSGAEERHLVQVGRRAMACQFEIYLNAGQHANGTEAALAALDLVEDLEQQMTVFRDSSEVSQINRTAYDSSVAVEPRLFSLFERATALYRETRGAYDITAGPLTKAWGFYRRAGAIPSAEELTAALARVGSHHLLLDSGARTVRFLAPGMELNLGSIGKGYALDRSAESMSAAGVSDLLIHGGQSSVLARGARATGAAEVKGWIVGVRHPLNPQQRVAEIQLEDCALATSGAGAQFFRHEGRRYGHILDPRTGYPAEGMFSATVVAPTAADADALSTAFYVLGVDATMEFCRSRPEIGALLIYPSASGTSVEIALAGLEERRIRLFDAS